MSMIGVLYHILNMRHAAIKNRRAHNERGGFRFGACSATTDDSPLLHPHAQEERGRRAVGRDIPMLLRLQVSSFGYEIYDVHMPHSIPLLKESVKREKILRIMVFGGRERPNDFRLFISKRGHL